MSQWHEIELTFCLELSPCPAWTSWCGKTGSLSRLKTRNQRSFLIQLLLCCGLWGLAHLKINEDWENWLNKFWATFQMLLRKLVNVWSHKRFQARRGTLLLKSSIYRFYSHSTKTTHLLIFLSPKQYTYLTQSLRWNVFIWMVKSQYWTHSKRKIIFLIQWTLL